MANKKGRYKQIANEIGLQWTPAAATGCGLQWTLAAATRFDRQLPYIAIVGTLFSPW